MAQEDSSRKIGSGAPRKMNKNPDGRFAAVVVAAIGLEAVGEFVAPVDRTVPSSHYSPMWPSHHSQDTLSSRATVADIGFAGCNRKAFAACLT
jgi:hypothetical protein